MFLCTQSIIDREASVTHRVQDIAHARCITVLIRFADLRFHNESQLTVTEFSNEPPLEYFGSVVVFSYLAIPISGATSLFFDRISTEWRDAKKFVASTNNSSSANKEWKTGETRDFGIEYRIARA